MVQTGYVGTDGARHAASDEALMGVLGALGVCVRNPSEVQDQMRAHAAARARAVLEPVVVHRQGGALQVTATIAEGSDPEDAWVALRTDGHCAGCWRLSELRAKPVGIAEGDGRRSRTWRLSLPRRIVGDLDVGYHRLEIETRTESGSAVVIAAPRTCPRPQRSWGVHVPLYALRGRSDWGSGSFDELGRLGVWAGELGATFTSTLPLCAVFDDVTFGDPSPYMPASRLAWNEMYIDIESIPEMAASSGAAALLSDPAMGAELGRLRRGARCDPRAVSAAKRVVLQVLARDLCSTDSARRKAFEAFAAEHGDLVAYARFRAECERQGRPWWEWPEREARAVRTEEVLSGGDRSALTHLYSQWVAEQQIHDASQRAVGLHLDIPIGVHAAGFDTFHEPDQFARGASVGAPPDDFFAAGQVWGFPPLHPVRMRDQGYRYFAAALRHSMKPAASVRIDHVLGLHRTYWVPEGSSASEGAYVRYRADELYAVVCVEAHLAGTVVVGEDLGTVPGVVRRAMQRDGLLRSFVFEFESKTGDPLPEAPQLSIASMATHDLAPFASYWRGLDIAERRRLGAIDDSEADIALAERASWRREVARRTGAPISDDLVDDASTRLALARCLAHLARGEAALVVVDLEDLWLETEPQNRPGTGPEAGNFVRRCRRSLEGVREDPSAVEILKMVSRARLDPGETDRAADGPEMPSCTVPQEVVEI